MAPHSIRHGLSGHGNRCHGRMVAICRDFTFGSGEGGDGRVIAIADEEVHEILDEAFAGVGVGKDGSEPLPLIRAAGAWR